MKLPPFKLDHLQRLTDERGIVQFAPLGVPDPSTGYAIDDNTRALVVTARLPRGRLRERLARIYVESLAHAQRPDGMLAHEAGFDGSLSETAASDDGFGRFIWACGEVAASDLPKPLKDAVASVLDRARPHVARISHVRGWSNAVQGLVLWAHHTGARWAEEAAVESAERILDQLASHSGPDWLWFENVITYEPGRLPLGMLYAAALHGDSRYLETAERLLSFLEQSLYELTTKGRIFTPAGNRGWYRRDGVRAVYDQQPIDAGSMVEAAAAAAILTGDRQYRILARDTFKWFLGSNLGEIPLYDDETGACHDGLTPRGVNLNAGAESTICYLIARLTIAALNHPSGSDSEPAKTFPISRLRAERPQAREFRGARHAGNAPAPQGHSWPPGPPIAGQLHATPSRR